ncbi:MAG: magnesium transporter [Candidatus Omnitrophica bacterium]|nr:magnesium transporter [Candidatus Omnitrophota bacterium]
MPNRQTLLPIVRKFFEEDPVRAAHSLETLDHEDAVSVLKALPPILSAEAFPYLQAGHAAGLLKGISPEFFKIIMEKLEPQQGAAIFMNLPSEARHNFLSHLSEKVKRQIQELLTYPEDSAGRIMTTDFLAFHTDLKAKEAIQKIRTLARKGSNLSYAYVIDEESRLVGVMNMRDLMLAPSDAVLDSVMRKDIFTVDAFMDREQVARELSKRKYFAAPVVDTENRLIGVVKAEHLIQDVQEEASEDIQKMFGAGGDERAFSPVRFSLSKRLPWLHVNLATAFLAGSVVGAFQSVIGKFPVLAIYLPVVAGQGGNAGSQALVVVIRGLVMREIPGRKALRLIFKELGIGIINGIVIGLVTAAVAWFWHGNPYLGLVVGLAMFVNLLVAGLTGATIPLLMKAVGLDPAQCSNIILTTFTDVMGFFSLLGFAVIFQKFLIP